MYEWDSPKECPYVVGGHYYNNRAILSEDDAGLELCHVGLSIISCMASVCSSRLVIGQIDKNKNYQPFLLAALTSNSS